MGKVILLLGRSRHARASASKPKSDGSAVVWAFRRARSKIKNFSGGMRPRAFQLLTADEPTPASSATAAVPPSVSTTASMDVSMPIDSSRTVNLSSHHNTALELVGASDNNPPMPVNQKSVGRRLEATRKALGLKAADICRAIDCQPNRWSQYESGERLITLPIAVKLTEHYGITLDWIYRGDPSGLPMRLHERVAVAAAS